MSLPKLDITRDPKLLIADLQAFVAQADAMIEAREMVELQGMDTAVEVLCKRIGQFTVVEAKTYTPLLEELMASIDALQVKMTALQGEISTTLKSLNTQKKAAKAYLNAPPSKQED